MVFLIHIAFATFNCVLAVILFFEEIGLAQMISLHLLNFFQAIRVASMNCIDELRALWCRIERSGKKNGTLLLE